MKISYTDSAQGELSRFLERQKGMIQEIVKEKKYVFGDEEIEITASDIREASERIRALPSGHKKKSFLSETISKLYILIGVSMATIGIAYPYLKALMSEDPFQFMLVTFGVTMTLLGYFMHFFFRSRKRSFERMIRLEHQRDELESFEEAIRKLEANKTE